ncbi:hypothetical protein [[Roseibacterium] beibuensis]|uniref:hypothetical protein n=1 Tax=[Roseibacterium] beibuensis TaxID=1193142 RepID=UPI00217D9945|nr:hypothetical protein [Roseibacterium beibuensis]
MENLHEGIIRTASHVDLCAILAAKHVAQSLERPFPIPLRADDRAIRIYEGDGRVAALNGKNRRLGAGYFSESENGAVNHLSPSKSSPGNKYCLSPKIRDIYYSMFKASDTDNG